MDEIVVRIDTAQAERFFAYAGVRARRMREPLRHSAGLLMSTIRLNFNTEGRATEGGWAPLKVDRPGGKYGRWKRKNFPGLPIGRLTGELNREALSERRLHFTPESVTYLFDDTKAESFNYGFTSGGKGRQQEVPPRPFFPSDDVMIAESVEDIFTDWIEDIHSIASKLGRASRYAGVPHPFD